AEKILENRVLSDGLWAAAPMDELELSDAVVGLKIKLASGVSCAERNLFNLLSDFEDMWQAEQDAEGMINDIDLTRETLHLRCGHKHFVRGAVASKRKRGVPSAVSPRTERSIRERVPVR